MKSNAAGRGTCEKEFQTPSQCSSPPPDDIPTGVQTPAEARQGTAGELGAAAHSFSTPQLNYHIAV